MSQTEAATDHLSLNIEGMTCASCVRHVEKAIATVPGVVDVSVNLALEKADITTETGKVSADQIAQAVSDSGYTPVENQTVLLITGMTCAACVSRLEKVLSRVSGVTKASVNLANETATISYFGENLLPQLIDAVEAAGFEAREKPADQTGSPPLPTDSHEQNHLIIGAILSLPLVAPMLAMPFGIDWMLPGWLQFVLATPVQFWLGYRFYRGGWKALRNGVGNMDLLVALGTSAAYFLSLYTLLSSHGDHGHLYFESSAVVITLVLLGKYLEARAKRKTADAVRALLDLKPETVRVSRNGQEIEIPASEVILGDILLIRPGERVPTDAIIQEGASEFDESMLTGESLPVYRDIGEKIIGGSLNGSGFIQAKAAAIGSDTTLAKIIKLVEGAQSSKAPIQKLVDQIAAIFVPVVVAIAVLTFAIWFFLTGDVTQALMPAVAVLVIACPCALGLATPTAIIAGTGAAARAGILIKDAETLERATEVKAVAFDKTGTLTLGKPELVTLTSFTGDRAQNLGLMAALQSGSEHPLARAVLATAEAENISAEKAENVKAIAGRGVSGTINGQTYIIGNQRYLEENSIPFANLEKVTDNETKQGRTVSYLIANTTQPEVIALMAFADTPRPSAKSAIAKLHRKHISAVMVTGDNPDSARNIADDLGIDQVKANVLPEEKAEIIDSLKQQYGQVAMVGDGINDAPALATADLGIAMGSGTDVAIAAAGITLMRSDPSSVADALDIASRTRSKIRQNLFWAFIYNVAGIPLAALGLLNPVFAGAAMAASSVCVVSNALLLRRWKPEQGE
ncbi:heavy metal translocating P-type ATPase [Microvirga sp. W0021]|uniref:Heavy metal translocating P-type ATPase n=1 Tax=Hohaiivirga grylli TaxID=3133970 RepID=A0ABV0BH70_9HYPH